MTAENLQGSYIPVHLYFFFIYFKFQWWIVFVSLSLIPENLYQTSSRRRRSRCDDSRTLQTNCAISFRDRKLSMFVWLDFGAKTATSTCLRLTMIWNTIGEPSYENLTSLNHDSGQVISGRRRGSDWTSDRMQCLFQNYTISLLTSRFATKSI